MGNELVWALVRPAFIVFGYQQFDFKSIGFLRQNLGMVSVLKFVYDNAALQ